MLRLIDTDTLNQKGVVTPEPAGFLFKNTSLATIELAQENRYCSITQRHRHTPIDSVLSEEALGDSTSVTRSPRNSLSRAAPEFLKRTNDTKRAG